MAGQAQHYWDNRYIGGTAVWDIGGPQSAFVRLADEGRLSGLLLDVGCGTGEHTLLAAARGADAIGIDIAPTAIAQARTKAAERRITARFEVADVFDLGHLGLTVDTMIDCGGFHMWDDDDDRARYIASLATVLRPKGHFFLTCASDRWPGTWGPRPVSEDELRAVFSGDWDVESITADTLDINPKKGTTQIPAWLAVITRT